MNTDEKTLKHYRKIIEDQIREIYELKKQTSRIRKIIKCVGK